MGVLLMALSCVETNGLDEVLEGEICMSPVLSDMAGTRAGSTTTLDSFRAFAYYSKSAAGQLWADAGEVYFTDHEFKKDNGSYVGDPSVYWPFSGSLIFAGYSSHDEDIVTDYNSLSKTLSIREFDVDGKHDLLYFLPELSDNKYKGDDENTAPVTATFNHALSCVAFTVVEGKGGKTITLKEIKLASVYIKGDMTVGATDPKNVKWENKTTSDLVIWNTGAALSSTALDIESFIIPGQAQNIMVTYRIDGENEDKTKTIEPKEIKDWTAGTRSQYDISINSMGELLITPTVKNNKVTHMKDANGYLIGSEVTVSLGNLTSEDRARITNLQIVVSSGSTVYKRYSLDKVPDNNTVTFMRGNSSNPDENKVYLPQGDRKYTVTVTYYDGLDNRSVSVNNITSSAPDFKFNVKVGTQPYKLTIRSAVVGISDEVLSELKAQIHIRFGTKATFRNGTLESRSQCIVNETMSTANGDYQMTQTGAIFDGVTVMAAENTSTYKVPSKYSIGTIVSHAADLQNGKKYVIRLHKNSSTAGWSCEGEGSLKHRTVPTDNIGTGYVFIYERDDTRIISSLDPSYKKYSAGAWASNYDWKYLQGNDSFSFSDTPAYFTCANRWGSDTGTDIDIYRESGSGMLNYYSGYLWGNKGPDYYKWDIYEVKEVE